MATTRTDRGAVPTELTISVPATPAALPEVRVALDSWLSGLGTPLGTRQDVVLVVDEALTNAVEHGYRCEPGHTVDLTAVHTPTGIAIRVRDSGTWKPQVDDGTRGRGLRMIAAIADRVDLAVTPGSTTLTAHVPHRD